MLKLAIVSLLLSIQISLAAISVGTVPPTITLSDNDGGRVDGSKWTSEELRGKVFVLFYADPDEKDLNDHVGDALKEQHFPAEAFQSIAVVNMAATWLPNFLIESSLKKKQKKFPKTIYVKDFNKVFVKHWQLADDSNDVVAFDKNGRVIFHRDGKLSEADLKDLLSLIKKNL